jgi:hypothetical protein
LRIDSPLREVRVGPPPAEPGPPRNRARILLVVTIVVLSIAAVAGVLIFAASRDKPDVSGIDRGPGTQYPDQGHDHLALGEEPKVRFASDPPTSGPHLPEGIVADNVPLSRDQILQALEKGNVVLFYDSPKEGRALRRLQRRVSGPYDSAVAAAGQSVVLARRARTKGVIAAAWRHLLEVKTPADPQLAGFIQYWLGRGVKP